VTTPIDRSIRCRLSDGVAAAVEFSAQDAATLRAGCARALAQYTAAYRRPTARLELQVRPVPPSEWTLGWLVPMRGSGLPVQVFVSATLLARRPPDDWTEIWQWVVNTRRQDHQLDGLAEWTRDCFGDPEGSSD
jgi:hypothetical protein